MLYKRGSSFFFTPRFFIHAKIRFLNSSGTSIRQINPTSFKRTETLKISDADFRVEIVEAADTQRNPYGATPKNVEIQNVVMGTLAYGAEILTTTPGIRGTHLIDIINNNRLSWLALTRDLRLCKLDSGMIRPKMSWPSKCLLRRYVIVLPVADNININGRPIKIPYMLPASMLRNKAPGIEYVCLNRNIALNSMNISIDFVSAYSFRMADKVFKSEISCGTNRVGVFRASLTITPIHKIVKITNTIILCASCFVFRTKGALIINLFI